MFFSSKMNSGVTLIEDKNNINCDLWVGNVDSRVDEKVILEIFQNAGPIKNIRMVTPRVIDGHKGYCFVQFYHECSVPYSIQVLEGTTLYGKKLKLQPRSGSFHSKAKKGEQLPDLIQQQVQLQQHQVHQQQQQIPQGQPLWYASTVPSTIPNMVVYANPTLQYSNVSYPHGGLQAAAQLVNPYMTIPTTLQQPQQIQGAVRLQQPQGYFPATIRAQQQQQQQSHSIPVQQPQPGGYLIQQPVMNQVIQVQNHPRPPSVLPSHHYVQTSNFPQQQIQSQFQQQQQPQTQQLNNNVRGPRPRLQNSNNNGNRISFQQQQQNNRALGAQAALVAQHQQQQQPQLFYNPMFTTDGQQLSILQPAGDVTESQQQFFRQQHSAQQQPPPAGTVILNGYQNPSLYHY